MTSVMTAVGPEAASSNFAWLTTTHLVVLALVAVFAVAILIVGARKKAARRLAEAELRDEGEAVSQATHLSDDAAIDMPSPSPAPAMRPPVAPAPPPLADVPVVAAAPNDAAPATIAAELATPDAGGETADDLTRMKGVGPKLAARLNELGITRFEQVAALDPAQADALDAQLGAFRGRLVRDRWIEQAGYLARDDRAGFEAAFGRL